MTPFMTTTPTNAAAADDTFSLPTDRLYTNLPTAELVEHVLANHEGALASSGAVRVYTGERTGRSPKNKFLEYTAGIQEHIKWGTVNQPCSPEQFEAAREIALKHLRSCEKLYAFEGFVGADLKHRLGVRVVTSLAWQAMFAADAVHQARQPQRPGRRLVDARLDRHRRGHAPTQ